MASGLGLKGNVSKCFYHFDDFVSCFKNSEEPLKTCSTLRDDYLECLHNKKLAIRTDVIKKQEEALARGEVPGHGAHGHGGGGH